MDDRLAQRLVPDGLWALVAPLLPRFEPRRQGGGTAPVDDRAVFTAIVFVLTAGCAWRHLPPSYWVSPGDTSAAPTSSPRSCPWPLRSPAGRTHHVRHVLSLARHVVPLRCGPSHGPDQTMVLPTGRRWSRVRPLMLQEAASGG